jgi:hypothetical protein
MQYLSVTHQQSSCVVSGSCRKRLVPLTLTSEFLQPIVSNEFCNCFRSAFRLRGLLIGVDAQCMSCLEGGGFGSESGHCTDDGFSPRPLKVGINYRYVSERWHRLMSELGYSRYGTGYDFGAGVTTVLALDHPKSVIGIHLTTLESDLAPAVEDTVLSDVERSYLAANRSWDATERGYSAIQSTKPQTVGYGLNDSPAGLAACVGEKWHLWSDVTPPDDFLCATLTLYWVTQTITSSMRDYWDNRWHPVAPLTSAHPRHLASLRTRPFPRASHHARISSTCTTSSAGQSSPRRALRPG